MGECLDGDMIAARNPSEVKRLILISRETGK